MPPEQAVVAAGFGVVGRARGLLIPVLKAASSTARHFRTAGPSEQLAPDRCVT